MESQENIIKVDQQAVRELLKLLSKVHLSFVREILQVIKDTEPKIKRIDTEKRETITIIRIAERHFELYSQNNNENYRYALVTCVKKIIDELQYYTPDSRLNIINEALAEVDNRIQLIDQFKSMIPEIKSAWRNLDPRTTAIFKILSMLLNIEDELNENFLDYVLNGQGDVDFLRDDPKLATLVRAYDLAQVIIEIVD